MASETQSAVHSLPATSVLIEAPLGRPAPGGHSQENGVYFCPQWWFHHGKCRPLGLLTSPEPTSQKLFADKGGHDNGASLSGEESACQRRMTERHRFDPWVGEISWGWKQQAAPVFLPGKSHGQRSLVSYSPRGCRESDMIEWLSTHTWPRRPDFPFYNGKESAKYIFIYIKNLAIHLKPTQHCKWTLFQLKKEKRNIHSLTWKTTVFSYSGMPSLIKRSRNSVCFKECLPGSCWAAVLWVRALLWTPIMVMMSLTSEAVRHSLLNAKFICSLSKYLLRVYYVPVLSWD